MDIRHPAPSLLFMEVTSDVSGVPGGLENRAALRNEYQADLDLPQADPGPGRMAGCLALGGGLLWIRAFYGASNKHAF